MRTTKKDLEVKVANLEQIRDTLIDKVYKLEQEVQVLKSYSVGGMTSSLVISAEKIAEAAAHLVSDARQILRR